MNLLLAPLHLKQIKNILEKIYIYLYKFDLQIKGAAQPTVIGGGGILVTT